MGIFWILYENDVNIETFLCKCGNHKNNDKQSTATGLITRTENTTQYTRCHNNNKNCFLCNL